MTEHMLHATERKILPKYDPIQEKWYWRPRWNNEIYSIFKDLNIVDDIKIILLGWMGNTMRIKEERIPKKILHGKFQEHKMSRKTKNMMEVIEGSWEYEVGRGELCTEKNGSLSREARAHKAL